MTQPDKRNRKIWHKPWLWVAGAILVLGVGGGGYYAMTPHGAAGYFRDGEAQLKKGNVSAALIQFRNAVQSAPEDAKARLALGQVLLMAGDPLSAEKELTVAKRLGAKAGNVMLPLAQAYLDAGKFAEALKEAPTGVGTPEQQFEAQILRGYANLGLRRYDDARTEFQAAAASHPEEPRAYIGLARVSTDDGKTAEAMAPVDRALKIAPKNAEALALKGELLRLGGNVPEAIGYFDKALAVDSRQMVAHIGRAVALIDTKKEAEARKDVDAILAVSPHHPVGNYLKALLLARENKTAEALDVLQKEPNALVYPPSLYLQGALQMARNDMEQARTSLEKYLRESPDDYRARLLLGNLLIRQGLAAQAVEVLKPAAAQAPKDSKLLAALANAYMRSGRPSEAQTYFDRAAAAAAPEDSQSRTELAMGRLQIGQSDAAMKDLEAVVEKDPGAVPARVLLALTHLRRGELEAAEKEAKDLLAQTPKSALPYNLMGAIALARNDVPAARAAFEKALAVQPDFTPARVNLAQLERRLGHPEKAAEQYQAILKSDAANLDAMTGLADLAFSERQPQQAVDWLLKARDAHPKEIDPRLRLVTAYMAQQEVNKALATARDLQLIAPNQPAALDALGLAQLAAGKPQDAIATFTQLAVALPTSARVQQRLASAYRAAKSDESARQALGKALQLDPNYTAAEMDLIDMAFGAGDKEQALRLAEEWRGKHLKATGVDALVGDVKMRAGLPREAAAEYSKAAAKQPSSALAIRYAEALRRAGDGAAATKSLMDWIAAHPADGAARMTLAGFRLLDGQYKEAATEYEGLLKQHPGDVAVYNNLAWVYGKLGDKRALGYAEKAYEGAPNVPGIVDTLGDLLVKQGDKERGVKLLREALAKSPKSPDIAYHLAAGLKATGKPEEARALLKAVLDSKVHFAEEEDAKALYRDLGGK